MVVATVNVAGIDFSTHSVDLVKLPLAGPADPEHVYVAVRDSSSLEAARNWRDYWPLASFGDWFDDVAVAYIERPYGVGESIHKLMRMQGAILAQLPTGLVVDELAPWEWRKLNGLPGNASKHHVALYVDQDSWTQDRCDAYCIALAGRLLCERAA